MLHRRSGFMKRRCFVIIVLVIFTSSCTHIREYSTFDDINTATRDKKTEITLSDDQSLIVDRLQITPDSTFWRNPSGGNTESVPTSEVKSVVVRNRGRGALEGFGLGTLIGFGVGVLIGLISGDDPGAGAGRIFSFTAEEKAGMFGILLGVPGGLLGLLAGASTGSKDKFIIEDKNQSNSK